MTGLLFENVDMPTACFNGVYDHCPVFYNCPALKQFCDTADKSELKSILVKRVPGCIAKQVELEGDVWREVK